MKPSLLKYLACPKCRADLHLEGEGVPEIDEGALRCAGCATRYQISRGIPRFPIADDARTSAVTTQTSKKYHFAWRRFGKAGHEKGWEKGSDRFTCIIPPELTTGPGRVGLYAGCGAGLGGVHQRLGVSVRRQARELLAGRPNVHFVQGDLNAPPLREGCFDFIYTFGVLHHLADTRLGFENLSRLLKPSAPLITYLYESFDARTRTERAVLSVVAGVRKATIKVPALPLYMLCWLATPPVWLFCSVPARLLHSSFPRLAEKIPYRHTLRWTVLASDLFDRFSPPVERRYTAEQVRELYHGAGLRDVEIRWFRGWVSWGRKATPVL